MSLNREQATAIVKESLVRIVPDADFGPVGPDDKLRETFEIDSLDFLGFVEALMERTGISLTEDDYPALTTLSSSAGLLVDRSATTAG